MTATQSILDFIKKHPQSSITEIMDKTNINYQLTKQVLKILIQTNQIKAGKPKYIETYE